MNFILSLYRCFSAITEKLLAPWLLPHLARFSFAAVLLGYYWTSAMTKFSEGWFGFLKPNVGAYYQILPTITEAVSYDIEQISTAHTLIVLFGSWAEVILPALIVVGLFTRGAALAMIGFIIVQSLTDIYGHAVDIVTRGMWFDKASDSLILDQRLFWVAVLCVLVVQGGGWLSLDKWLKIDR